MTAYPDRPRTWSLARRVPAWWPSLVEPAVSPEETAPPPACPAPRLSRSGQILLGVGLSMMALMFYTLTLRWSLWSNQQSQFCQPPSLWGAPPGEGERQTKTLIDALAGATASQKVRLRQQALILQVKSARLCDLVILSRAQEEALLGVATAALCLLSLTILQGLGEGLAKNTNRTLRAVQISATGVLVTTVAFLHLGQEVRNTGRLFQLYLSHRNLQQQFVSALANQDRPVFRLQVAHKSEKGVGNGKRLPPPLSDSTQVAMLIRAVDAQLQSLPHLTVNLNESGARKILSLIDDGIDQGS